MTGNTGRTHGPSRPPALSPRSFVAVIASEKTGVGMGILDRVACQGRVPLVTAGAGRLVGSGHADGKPKKLQYLSFGAFDDDFDALCRRIESHGACEPHPLDEGEGVWTRDPSGTPIQVVVAPEVSPSVKSQHAPVGPVGRHHCPHARRARQRPSPCRVHQVARTGLPSFELGCGKHRRGRARGGTAASAALHPRLGCRAARARLQLSLLRAGYMGQLGRGLARCRLTAIAER